MTTFVAAWYGIQMHTVCNNEMDMKLKSSHSHELQNLKEYSPKNAQINRMFCTLTLRVAHKNSNEKEFLRSAAQPEQSHEPFVSFLAALLIVFRRVCSSPRAILPHHVTVHHSVIQGVSNKVTNRMLL